MVDKLFISLHFYPYPDICSTVSISYLFVNLGSLESLKYLVARGYKWRLTVKTAAEYGHVDILKFAEEQGQNYNIYDVCLAAVEKGHVNVLQYIYATKKFGDTLGYVAKKAAENGQLECLKFMHKHGAAWDRFTCKEAAAGGHLECLK
jgi:hypothetical protein